MIREKLSAGQSVEASGFRRRAGDVSRLEQFSDAVFGFAMALLVVSTEVPRTASDLYAVLWDFPAFGLTFAVLIWFWWGHNVYFRRFGLVDAFTTFLNGVLLFLILFCVYPMKFILTALLNSLLWGQFGFARGDANALMALYSLGFTAVFGMFALLYRHALAKRDELELDEREILVTHASMGAYVILVVLSLSSAMLTGFGPAWAPPVAGGMFSLIGPLMWWHWSRFHRRLAALPATERPLTEP
jgi:uncharacterized membrane protein